MPIPWMLVWFGVLGFQDRATNLGFGIKKVGTIDLTKFWKTSSRKEIRNLNLV